MLAARSDYAAPPRGPTLVVHVMFYSLVRITHHTYRHIAFYKVADGLCLARSLSLLVWLFSRSSRIYSESSELDEEKD